MTDDLDKAISAYVAHQRRDHAQAQRALAKSQGTQPETKIKHAVRDGHGQCRAGGEGVMKTIAVRAVDAVLSELRREFVRGCQRDCHGYYDDYPSCSPLGCEQARHIALLDEAIQHLREADEDPQRAEKAEAERDALRAEGVAMRGACLVACNTCREFPDADREHFIPRYPSCVEEGCIVYQALSAPLTAAAAERVKAMERVCEVAKRTINCDKWGTAECSYDCQGKNWDVCEALAALDAKGEE